jgi:hypothetical protein
MASPCPACNHLFALLFKLKPSSSSLNEIGYGGIVQWPPSVWHISALFALLLKTLTNTVMEGWYYGLLLSGMQSLFALLSAVLR